MSVAVAIRELVEDLKDREVSLFGGQGGKPPRLSLQERQEVYEQLSTLMADNVELTSALSSMVKRLRHRRSASRRVKVYRYWLGQMRAGKNFSQAVEGTVGTADQSMLLAVEQAQKDMHVGMAKTAELMERTERMRRSIIGLVVNVVYIALMVMALIAVVSIRVVPALSTLVPSESQTGSYRVLVAMSDFLTSPWALLVPALLALSVYGVLLAMRHWSGRWRDALGDRLPGFGVYKIYNGAIALYAIAMLQEANIELMRALEVMRANASPWLARHLSDARRALASGQTPDVALDSPMFTPTVRDNIAVFASASDFRAALTSLGRRNIEDAVIGLERASTVARNLMLVCIFLFMAFVYVSVSTMVMSFSEL